MPASDGKVARRQRPRKGRGHEHRDGPIRLTIALAIGFELLALWLIRDNLALNILMLVAPVDAIHVRRSGA